MAQLTDTFQYQATDGVLPSNWATVSIIVNGVNNPPTANPDSYATDEDTRLFVSAPGVLINDSDPEDGNQIVVSGYDAISVMGALVTVNANGSLSYDPRTAPDIQKLALGETADGHLHLYGVRHAGRHRDRHRQYFIDRPQRCPHRG